jgi:hypothetical protein
MREHARGQYQGVFSTGEAAAITAGPAVMTTLVAGAGVPGWIVLGAVFVTAGAVTIPVTRWAVRTRGEGDRGAQVRPPGEVAAAGDGA